MKRRGAAPYNQRVMRGPLRSLWRLVLLAPLMFAAACPGPQPLENGPPAPPADAWIPCAVKGQHCGGPAGHSVDCCNALSCDSAGVCSDGYCFSKGNLCSSDDDCCGSLQCFRGVCGDGYCLPDNSFCSSNRDCCNGSCNHGNCTLSACLNKGQSCADDTDCCGGPDLTCDAGGCFNWACVGVGQACATSNDCCGVNTCAGGTCQCVGAGVACTGDADCCGDLTCSLQQVCQ